MYQAMYKTIHVFRTMSNIYDEAFLDSKVSHKNKHMCKKEIFIFKGNLVSELCQADEWPFTYNFFAAAIIGDIFKCTLMQIWKSLYMFVFI